MPKDELQSRPPADPEGQNDDRAEWAMAAVKAFQGETGLGDDDGLDTAISDLLADLAHLCDRHNLQLGHLLRRAAGHYDAETSTDYLREDDRRDDEPDMIVLGDGEQFDDIFIGED